MKPVVEGVFPKILIDYDDAVDNDDNDDYFFDNTLKWWFSIDATVPDDIEGSINEVGTCSHQHFKVLFSLYQEFWWWRYKKGLTKTQTPRNNKSS